MNLIRKTGDTEIRIMEYFAWQVKTSTYGIESFDTLSC